jgi:hypothetical protein
MAKLSASRKFEGQPRTSVREKPHRNPNPTDVGARARGAILAVAGQGQPLWPLLSEPRHTLLLFEDAGSPMNTAELIDLTDKHLAILRLTPENDPDRQARERYRQHGPGWVLIRPDQVVAARDMGATSPCSTAISIARCGRRKVRRSRPVASGNR